MKEYQYEYKTDRFKPLTCNYCVGLKNAAHYHNQIELFYVISGTQLAQINGREYEAKKGDIIFCNPYDIHHFYCKFPATILFIGIPTSLLSSYNSFTGTGRLCANYLPKSKSTAEIFKVMKEFSSAKKHSELYSSGLVNKLLALLCEAIGVETQSSKKSQTLIQVIINYINDNYKSPLTLKNIAEHCSYSPYYISRIFNATFNCNLNSYINLRRLEALVEIKNQNPQTPVVQAAFDVGFTTQRTFYRVFREMYGCTPRQYFASEK